MRLFLLISVLSLLLSSCAGDTSRPKASGAEKRYSLKGKVISVDKTKKTAEIHHEEIEGFMEAMTMTFPIHDEWVWTELKPGSEIRAELVVDSTADQPYWLENIGIIAAGIPGQADPVTNEAAAVVGKEPPDVKLTNQDGRPLSLRSFRGKATAVTFIYAECPLPEFCIKMSTNFSDLANELRDNAEMRDKVRLLSVSFDPERDTPEKLRSYGVGYLGNQAKPDFTIWQLAVGEDAEVRKLADFLGLRYETDPNDKTQINHSLRTAVIGPDGKVARVFTGSGWTKSELLASLRSTLQLERR
jgi:protein SCO1